MQKIMVCIKRVVVYNVRVRVKPDGSGVDWSATCSKSCPNLSA